MLSTTRKDAHASMRFLIWLALNGAFPASLSCLRSSAVMQLMADFTAYGWHWNTRGKGQVLVPDAAGQQQGKFRELLSQHGHLVVLNDVYLTAQSYGPVNIAAIHAFGAKEPWLIAHDEPRSPKTFSEYHERFQIAEGFLDFKSGGFNLEDTCQTQLPHLEGLLFLLETASLFLLNEGTHVMEVGQRTRVDPHWHRGLIRD